MRGQCNITLAALFPQPRHHDVCDSMRSVLQRAPLKAPGRPTCFAVSTLWQRCTRVIIKHRDAAKVGVCIYLLQYSAGKRVSWPSELCGTRV